MSSASDELPNTICIGKGIYMTFLRNDGYLTRTRIASDAVFEVPPHWHEENDEYMHILQGQLEITVSSHTRVYGPEDGEIKIPKGAVHSLQNLKDGGEVIVEERMDQMDEQKELLFRNMFSEKGISSNIFELMHLFYYGDARPGLPGHIQWLERGLVTVLGYYIAPMMGYKRRLLTLKKTQ